MAIRDITLGQYFPVESKIHSLDARTKIIGVLGFLVSLFFVKSFVGFAIAAVFLAVLIKISKVPFKFMVKGLKAIVLIIILTMLVNCFFTPGTPIFTIWKISLTKEGLYRATFMAVRLVILILGSSLLTLTTKPLELTDGLEKLMKPMAKIGMPAHEIAMMMSIALRFIPTLLEETDKIMKAQQARGVDFEGGKLMDKAKALVPLLVPLFVSAFRIASDLAMAMEARCYHGGGSRTRMNEMKFKKADAFAFVICSIFVAAIISLRFVPETILPF